MPTTERDSLRQLNLYEVLQVSAKASPEVLQAAYRVLARAYHPDVNRTPGAARMMRQLNAAYTVLSDPVRRAKYDAQRAHSWRARSHVEATRVEHPTRPDQPSRTEHPPRGKPRPGPTPINANVARQQRVAAMAGAPIRTGWRISRLLGLLVFLAVMLGMLMFAFWLIVGFLEEENLGPIRAAGHQLVAGLS
jgi:hypothetical protein